MKILLLVFTLLSATTGEDQEVSPISSIVPSAVQAFIDCHEINIRVSRPGYEFGCSLYEINLASGTVKEVDFPKINFGTQYDVKTSSVSLSECVPVFNPFNNNRRFELCQ